jgi:hypothetical protein
VVAVEGHDEIAGRDRESAFIGAAVAPDILPDHLGAQPHCHLRGAVRGSVVHDNHLVHEFRHGAQHLLDPLLLVQARDDDRNRLTLIHLRASEILFVFLPLQRVSLSWM